MPASRMRPVPEEIRHDWSMDEILALFALPFNDLLFRAQNLHRQHFDPNQVQVSSLLSIKTGGQYIWDRAHRCSAEPCAESNQLRTRGNRNRPGELHSEERHGLSCDT